MLYGNKSVVDLELLVADDDAGTESVVLAGLHSTSFWFKLFTFSVNVTAEDELGFSLFLKKSLNLFRIINKITLNQFCLITRIRTFSGFLPCTLDKLNCSSF